MDATESRKDRLIQENTALRGLAATYQHLSALAAQDTDIVAATEVIAERMDAAIAVVDQDLEVLAATASRGCQPGATRLLLDQLGDPRLTQVLHVASTTRRALRVPHHADASPIIVAPVLVGDATAGYVVTANGTHQADSDDLRLLLTDHAATICGVILGRERIVAAAATQARCDLVEGLVSGNSGTEEVRRWAAYLGYDDRLSYRVLSVVLTDGVDTLGRRVPAAVERLFTTHAPEAITAQRGREVVVVFPEPDGGEPRALRMANVCLDRIREMFGDGLVVAGIGRPCHSATEIARSYDDARHTVDIAIRMGRTGTAVAVEDLGIHRLLLQVADADQLREFARDVFGGLMAQANGNAAEYLSTLASYFRENNSLQGVARELHVHPNTVSYRVRRVEEMTALDFHNYRDRLMAQVALEILDVVGDSL